MIYESGENYLETLLRLKEKMGSVRSIDLAAELNYSKPSISRAVSVLKNAGYITVDGEGHLDFTEEGARRANEIYEKHRTLQRFLHEKLGVEEHIAEKDACRVEHIISEASFAAIQRSLDN